MNLLLPAESAAVVLAGDWQAGGLPRDAAIEGLGDIRNGAPQLELLKEENLHDGTERKTLVVHRSRDSFWPSITRQSSSLPDSDRYGCARLSTKTNQFQIRA